MVEPLSDEFWLLILIVLSLTASCLQLHVGFRSSLTFDSDAAHENFLLEIRVQYTEISNIYDWYCFFFLIKYAPQNLSHILTNNRFTLNPSS